MVDRPFDWPERFAAFIESRRFQPFQWGVNDCALFAADWVLLLTGVDHAEGLRGQYHDEAGAQRLIARAGGMQAFARKLPEKPAGLVQKGDVVLALIDERLTFGLALGNGHWCAPGERGLVFRQMSDVVQVFES